jgi:uroporphyrin-3 C-methyltransferase
MTEPTPSAPADRGVSRAGLVSAFALLLALVAAAVAGSLWWQYRQFYLSLNQTDAEAAAALERVRADLRGLKDEVDALEESLGAERHVVVGLAERLDQIPGRLGDLERRLNAVQGGSVDTRDRWLRAEAEYFLTVANTELTLAGRWENAIRALELADGRLADLGDPALSPVRERIADELQSLRSVRLPDIEGISFSLARLAARVDELPLRAGPPISFERPRESVDAEPGFDRLWQTLRNALGGIVRVERRDEPVTPMFSSAEELAHRRQLQIELQAARLAALEGNEGSYLASLRAAIDLLRNGFATDSAHVDGAITLLTDLQNLRIAPERPDISGSLRLLRNAGGGSP